MTRISSLGPLEREVMQCLWGHRKKTVREVHECLRKSRTIAYTTVLTILDRLNKKGIVSRKKMGKAYVYTPRFTKEQMLRKIAHQTLTSLSERYGSEALAAFAQEFQDLPRKKRRQIVNMLLEEHE